MGSKPRRVSLKPFFPAAAPWHGPELQPTFVITGRTSLRKLHVVAEAKPLTVSGAVVRWPWRVAVMVAWPSPAGTTTSSFPTFATAGSDTDTFACDVSSCSCPSANVASTRIRWPYRGPRMEIEDGRMEILTRPANDDL